MNVARFVVAVIIVSAGTFAAVTYVTPDRPVVASRLRRLHQPRMMETTLEPSVWCDTANGNLIYTTERAGIWVVVGGCQ